MNNNNTDISKMKYKSNTKDDILSLRLPLKWKAALKEIANSQDKSLNAMLFGDINEKYKLQINPILNKGKKFKTYENIEDIPLNP